MHWFLRMIYLYLHKSIYIIHPSCHIQGELVVYILEYSKLIFWWLSYRQIRPVSTGNRNSLLIHCAWLYILHLDCQNLTNTSIIIYLLFDFVEFYRAIINSWPGDHKVILEVHYRQYCILNFEIAFYSLELSSSHLHIILHINFK